MRSKKKFHVILTHCPQQVVAHADTVESAMKLAFRYAKKAWMGGITLTSYSVVTENDKGGWNYVYTVCSGKSY